jgi:hypothetical protein
MTAAYEEVEEVVDEITEDDYNLAIYLYDNEENPVACATLDVVTEEEAEFYDEFINSKDGGDVRWQETMHLMLALLLMEGMMPRLLLIIHLLEASC